MDEPQHQPAEESNVAVAEARTPRVEFRQATLLPTHRAVHTMRQINLQLEERELSLVRLEAGREALPLVDAALGLLPPASGEVLYQGRCWDEWSPVEQTRHRGRVGRVFHGEAWISNLSLRDNVLLASRHHTQRSESELSCDLVRWSERFGLADVPRERTSQVPTALRRLAEWVRAFLIEPEVLLLEDPTAGVPRTSVPALIAAVDEVTSRASCGATVLWLTTDEQVWSTAFACHVRRYWMRDEFLEPARGAS
jgi:ABC-type transporter Mla maintaining outer membrane lipid asymmetry ATPase subunit MlaF